jgi:hypothetical protein
MLDMFSVVFGIPLSFAALLTGITLGVGSSRYDVLALAVATGLAVYKPGRPRSRKAAADRQALLPRP